MRRMLWPFVILLLFGCTSNDDIIGSKVDQYIKSQTTFVLIDTFSVNLNSILIDSIETSSAENLLVGKYTDSEFGTLAATTYFQLDLPDDISLEKDEYDSIVEAYDSMTLVLRCGDLAYGDTLQPQTLKVYRLLEEIEIDENGAIYNTTSFKYNDTPLGEITYTPRPYRDDSVVIRLDDSMGLEFFEKMKNSEDDVTSDDDFKEFFKGLVIVSDDQNTAVLSFLPDTTTKVSLHTHVPGLTRTEKTHNFSFGTTGNYFNHIDCDRTGTDIEMLNTQREAIPSSQTGNKAFIEAGAGIVMRVNIPGIQRLLEYDNLSFMYKAELSLRVYPDSDKEINPPEQLLMYYTDKYNNLMSEIQNSDLEAIYSNYYSDDIYDEYNYYTLDLTEFLSNELSSGYVDDDLGMIISVPETEFKSSLNRLVIDARSGSQYRPVLNIYVALFE